jgi:hypothetical protein
MPQMFSVTSVGRGWIFSAEWLLPLSVFCGFGFVRGNA